MGGLIRLLRDLLRLQGEYGIRWLIRRLTRSHQRPPQLGSPVAASSPDSSSIARPMWLTSLLAQLAGLPNRFANLLDAVALKGLSDRWRGGAQPSRELFPLPQCPSAC